MRRIKTGYCDETPRGGRRWIVHDPARVTWHAEVFARRPGGPAEPTTKTLIEWPTFAILGPSNGRPHPSGHPYRRVSGGFATIATVTADEHADLIALARTFDAMRAAEAEPHPNPRGDRAGDAFNRCASWRDALEPSGWQQVYVRDEVGYWRRPGKPRGVSATTNHGGSDRLHVFTSSTAFNPDHSYSKFGAYAVLQHAGDFAAAAHDLANRDYGDALATTAVDGTRNKAHDSAHAPARDAPVLVHLRDVAPEAITWLWPGRLAIGKVALHVGDPGLGKSWIALDLAARVSAGRAMPEGGETHPPGDVLLLSAEDGLADTIRPRLDALGADLGRIHHLAVLRTGERERAVQLADTAALERAIHETRARLVIVDPVSAYLGSTDSHRDAEVRGLMAPLAALADRTAVALLGIMHLAKQAQRPAIYRAVGSIAFAAAARLVLAVAADPNDEDRRILALVKSNLAAKASALAYTLREGCLTWAAEPIAQVDVDALLSGPPVERAEHRAMDTWLRDLLADGPVPVRNIQAAAHEAGVVWRTVERAKTRLGVHAFLRGFGATGRWSWQLPEADTAHARPAETDARNRRRRP